uniref:ComEA family DNA-binding protein n=1 Tax=Dictyoglomus thermophilum TaxID=14 RepID=A0A7C3MI39_DICTH
MFDKKEKIIIIIFVCLVIVFTVFNLFGKEQKILEEDVNSFIVVHVAGEVKIPGVYKLRDGARVIDAINVAGGPLPSADLDKLNLADYLKDASKINVPSKVQYLNSVISSKEELRTSVGISTNDKININTASKQQLETLPGIGTTLAQRIIDYRNEHGLFTSYDDLLNVKGIGEKKLEKIKDKITW